ncbi:endonuclease domain-containing protein [Sphingobium sp. ZW T5_29]|uniref:endonuclease domain-containing protein n=1 Tax=Sphingobium sp. ZW T5_29 TaxID=3378077 RepID=UPI003854B097
MSEIPDTIMRAIEAVAADYRRSLISTAPYLSHYTESPIETAMFLSLIHELRGKSDYITVKPQEQIGRYRADFLLECEGRRLVVECDGHDFHERTKKQAARDRSRDRWFISECIHVMRFTGSEIYADALSCARQAVSHVEKIGIDAFWARSKEPV